MEMSPNPPDFSGVRYTAGMADVGGAFAHGMQAGQAAGESIGKGITTAADIMNRRSTATDTLNAMHGTGMLSDDAYKAIAGKSLGAQESMIGMYANQWIAQQAQSRALQQQGYGANLDVWKQHQALLDEINKLKETRPQTLPMQQSNQQPQTPAPQAQPVQPMVSQQNLPIGQQNLTVSGIPGVAAPLGSGNITNPVAAQPQYRIGAPFKSGEATPSGAKIGRDAQGNPGLLVPDANAPGGWSFRPRGA